MGCLFICLHKHPWLPVEFYRVAADNTRSPWHAATHTGTEAAMCLKACSQHNSDPSSMAPPGVGESSMESDLSVIAQGEKHRLQIT